MSDAEFIIKLLKSQVRPLNLNDVCSCIPAIPRNNVKDMLEMLSEKGLVKETASGGPIFPRTFEVK